MTILGQVENKNTIANTRDVIDLKDFDRAVYSQNMPIAGQRIGTPIIYQTSHPPQLTFLNEPNPPYSAAFTGGHVGGMPAPIKAEYLGQPFNVYLSPGLNTTISYNLNRDRSGFEFKISDDIGSEGHFISGPDTSGLNLEPQSGTVTAGHALKFLIPVAGQDNDMPVRINNESQATAMYTAGQGRLEISTDNYFPPFIIDGSQWTGTAFPYVSQGVYGNEAIGVNHFVNSTNADLNNDTRSISSLDSEDSMGSQGKVMNRIDSGFSGQKRMREDTDSPSPKSQPKRHQTM